MNFLITPTGDRYPISNVRLLGDGRITFQMERSPSQIAGFLLDDRNGNTDAHPFIPQSLNMVIENGKQLQQVTVQKVGPPVDANRIGNTQTKIDPNRWYNRSEIAQLLCISEADVQQLWNNWQAQTGDRLNFIIQTGRNSGRQSSGQHILDYFKRSGRSIP